MFLNEALRQAIPNQYDFFRTGTTLPSNGVCYVNPKHEFYGDEYAQAIRSHGERGVKIRARLQEANIAGESHDVDTIIAEFFAKNEEGHEPVLSMFLYPALAASRLQNTDSIASGDTPADVKRRERLAKFIVLLAKHGIKPRSEFNDLVFRRLEYSAVGAQQPKIIVNALENGVPVKIRMEAVSEVAYKTLVALDKLEVKRDDVFSLSFCSVANKYIDHNVLLSLNGLAHDGKYFIGVDGVKGAFTPFVQKRPRETMEKLFSEVFQRVLTRNQMREEALAI